MAGRKSALADRGKHIVGGKRYSTARRNACRHLYGNRRCHGAEYRKGRRIDGEEHEPAADVVETGDYITAVDHHAISGKADLLDAVGQIDGGDIVLTLRRGEETMDRKISPIEYEPGQYRLGIWVRDNVQGLGTVTFLTEQSRFGALGHGISDTDTNMLMTIESGRVYRTSIQDITKGSSGSPGTMEGIIVYNKYNILGTIDKNTEAGIYGTIEKIDELFDEQIPVETASKEEIEIGAAKIRCYIDNEIKEYDIQVTDIDMTASEANKGLVIQVTDSGTSGKNRRYHPGNERKPDHTEREADRSSDTCVRAGFDKGVWHIYRKYAGSGRIV